LFEKKNVNADNALCQCQKLRPFSAPQENGWKETVFETGFQAKVYQHFPVHWVLSLFNPLATILLFIYIASHHRSLYICWYEAD